MNTHNTQLLETTIQQLLQQYHYTHPETRALNALLHDVAAQALLSSQGGKRLRARLLLTFVNAIPIHHNEECGSTTENEQEVGATIPSLALHCACAIEIFQTAALVHDDIIDNSPKRRGKPSAHYQLTDNFQHFFTENNPDSTSTNLHTTHCTHTADDISNDNNCDNSEQPHTPLAWQAGNGLGIMLGDLLATMSVDIVHRSLYDKHIPALYEQPNNFRQSIMNTFLTMHREVENGQLLDIAIEGMNLQNPQELLDNSLAVFRWKTASYTTIAPIEIAFIIAGIAPEKAHNYAQRIGIPLGVAFQLSDDLLDVIGNTLSTGKPVGGDILEGKRTVLLADALRMADRTQIHQLHTIWNKTVRNSQDVAEAINIFQKTGAIQSSQQRITELWEETITAITAICDECHWAAHTEKTLIAICREFIPVII